MKIVRKGDLEPQEIVDLNPYLRDGNVTLLFITAWQAHHANSDVMLLPGTERTGYLVKDLELGSQIWIKKEGDISPFRTKYYIRRICGTEDGRLILENDKGELYLLEKVRSGD